jgi:E3 ubiquitin-protein ligase synoviolin
MALIRLRTYSALSVLVTTILVAYSANQYQQFYPVIVNLVSSKLSRLVLINDAILFVILFGNLLKTMFLGKLRTSEEEVRQIDPMYLLQFRQHGKNPTLLL